MAGISEIYEFLCELAPLEKQMSFDNSGFQIGYMSFDVKRTLLALDVTDEVVSEAMDKGAKLIISHHPILFHPPKSISDSDVAGARLLTLAREGISVISMHTNLDIADGGVNDVLIRLLGAEPEEALDSEGCGRIGILKDEMPLPEFLIKCKDSLNVKGLKYYSCGKAVSKLAVMGGAGGDALEDAYAKGCDTYVTADIKYHSFLTAAELGINLIDADHFCTENPVMYLLKQKLSVKFPDTEFIISERHRQITDFI